MTRVLVIAASMAQAENILRQHAAHHYSDIEFRYPANISQKQASLQVMVTATQSCDSTNVVSAYDMFSIVLCC